MQRRGLGTGGMFRAIESVGGGQLKAHEIRALVETLGTEEGLGEFVRHAHPGQLAERVAAIGSFWVDHGHRIR